MFRKGTKVKVIQKNAPYGFEGKEGVIVYSEYDLGGKWFLVQIHKTNKTYPYESFFLGQHLEIIKGESV